MYIYPVLKRIEAKQRQMPIAARNNFNNSKPAINNAALGDTFAKREQTKIQPDSSANAADLFKKY